MSGILLSHSNITLASIIIPGIAVAIVWLRFRHGLHDKNLSYIFIQSYTFFAAIMVMIGVFFPKWFDILGENSAFLIIISLSAVLNSISTVSAVIADAKSRSKDKSIQKLSDKVR